MASYLRAVIVTLLVVIAVPMVYFTLYLSARVVTAILGIELT